MVLISLACRHMLLLKAKQYSCRYRYACTLHTIMYKVCFKQCTTVKQTTQTTELPKHSYLRLNLSRVQDSPPRWPTHLWFKLNLSSPAAMVRLAKKATLGSRASTTSWNHNIHIHNLASCAQPRAFQRIQNCSAENGEVLTQVLWD